MLSRRWRGGLALISVGATLLLAFSALFAAQAMDLNGPFRGLAYVAGYIIVKIGPWILPAGMIVLALAPEFHRGRVLVLSSGIGLTALVWWLAVQPNTYETQYSEMAGLVAYHMLQPLVAVIALAYVLANRPTPHGFRHSGRILKVAAAASVATWLVFVLPGGVLVTTHLTARGLAAIVAWGFLAGALGIRNAGEGLPENP